MAKSIFVLLIGNKERGETNDYQLLQEETALGEGKRLGADVEVAFAPGFDQLRVLRKRLLDATTRPLDAVVTEPASVATMDLILRDLKGRTGLVLLNAWGPSVEEHSRAWGSEHPFGTVSTDHTKIGEIQGRQISAMLPTGGNVLCVTGPQRSSAAQQRLAGAKSTLKPGINLFDTEAGQWTEADGIGAFNGWYGIFKARADVIHVVAAHNDELATGARNAAKALANPGHRDMFSKAKYLGVDASPRYGRRLVDSGALTASITTPANTGVAIAQLQSFWRDGRAVALRAFTEATPYPPGSAG
jgi:ABC-type sugar transport system substrate-binding protein